ncbi:Putative stress-induced transcription regulator [Actinopolyspora xinjiangensis]|uniref:Putative stress-induced transcription regulator n=1 Tax=Actinopolyspora xinjiangensis TaxID=405564 RepID=A0A1H0V4Z5_9ACTN|nr:CGNR zinc finger domain-containing protein [Actinopolyspora xinjiangensis]SDP73403.1 Putative stress-induced transcription regulator [Actinopolyspora xinjiangensis]
MADWSAAALIGDHPALLFVNTVGGRTRARDVEYLREFTDAADWAHAAGLLEPEEHDYLLSRAADDRAEADGALAELREQREALHAFLLAGVERVRCERAVRDRVKADVLAAQREAEPTELFRERRSWVFDTARLGPRLVARRAALASAELLLSEQRSLIGVCGRCSWLFLDPSPSRRRRWCSMAICGNRAKVERHQRGRGR